MKYRSIRCPTNELKFNSLSKSKITQIVFSVRIISQARRTYLQKENFNSQLYPCLFFTFFSTTLLKKLSSLPLSEQLVGGNRSHSGVSGHQSVVDRKDLSAVSGPCEPSSDHGNLLEAGDSLDRGVDISNVNGSDEPLDAGAVEEHWGRLGSCLKMGDHLPVNGPVSLANHL
jgi:hypothetical protein